MDNELRTKIKQLLFEVSEGLNNPKPKTFLHQIEIVEDVVRIKRFKGIIDPIKMASWLIPEIGQVFRFEFERPDTSRKEKNILAKKVFSINEINDYIRDYIFELDNVTSAVGALNEHRQGKVFLINVVRELYEKGLNDGTISSELTESKKGREISTLLISATRAKIKDAKLHTVSDYLRNLLLKKKDGDRWIVEKIKK